MRPDSRSLPDRARRACRTLVCVPYRAYAMRRMRTPGQTSLLGRRLMTDPQVFHPIYFHSTHMLAKALLRQPIAERRVLEVGTGSGAVAIIAATSGASVVACDINPHAVELARRNAQFNNATIDVRQSDLFENLRGERFDFICFNVPFYPRAADDIVEHAFNAGEDFATIRRFASAAADHLLPDGRVIVIFSEDSGYETMARIFADNGWRIIASEEHRKFFETFHIVSFGRTTV